MLLRPARPDDADAVTAVLWESRADALPWVRVVHDRADVRRWVGAQLLPTCRVVVAEDAGRVVGVAALHEGWLEQLYVAPQAQGRGVGRSLLDDARAASPGGLQLWTFARNARARRFYADAGFTEVEHGDGSGNEEGEPDVRMRWPGVAGSDAGTGTP